MAAGREHEQRELAKRVLALMRLVAGGSPTKLSRLMNGVDPNKTHARSDAKAGQIESDRRQIQRWLAGAALMEEASRVELIEVANRVLAERGEPLLPADYLTIEKPDPIEEISRKLDLLLLRLGPEETPLPKSEVAAAFVRYERFLGGGEPGDPDAQKSDEGAS